VEGRETDHPCLQEGLGVQTKRRECREVRGESSEGTQSQERRQHEIRLSRRRGEENPERMKNSERVTKPGGGNSRRSGSLMPGRVEGKKTSGG
jgi:hypothetical protein